MLGLILNTIAISDVRKTRAVYRLGYHFLDVKQTPEAHDGGDGNGAFL